MALNRQQLAKILEMMGSVHDGEALAAARRAHMLVKNSGVSWETLLGAHGLPMPPGALHRAAPVAEPQAPRRAKPHGRELTSYEMLYALLHSNRTPALLKKQLKPMEARLVEGDVAEHELIELRSLFTRYVVATAEA